MKTLICALLMLSVVALAEEPTGWPSLKVRGVEYKDVKVVSSDASSIKIIHESGAARILIKDLPMDVQKLFAYDSDAAKANEAKLAKEQKDAQSKAYFEKIHEKERALEIKSALPITLKIERVMKKGVIASDFQVNGEKVFGLHGYGRVFFSCDPQGFAEGEGMAAMAHEGGTVTLGSSVLRCWEILDGTRAARWGGSIFDAFESAKATLPKH